MTSTGATAPTSVIDKDTYGLGDETGAKCCSLCAVRYRQMSRLTRASFEPLRPTGLYLGTLRHIDQSADCPLCRFFHLMRFEDSTSNDYHLVAWIPLQLLTPDHSVYPNVSGLPGSFLFGVTAWADQQISGLQAIQRSKNAGFVAMESAELRNGTPTKWIDDLIFHKEPFRGRKVDWSNLDYSLLQHWVQSSAECETRWSSFVADEEALRQQLQSVPICVIDCSTRSVVAWTGEMEFVALSYVWGSLDMNMVETTYRFPYALPPTCPLVIEDSITVVQKLSLRYLWVDQYCISQSNKPLRQAQISRMDSIYRWAKFTIVAAAGQDSMYGLPGVSSRPRLRQPSIIIEGNTLLATLPDPNTTLQKSKWNTRAWTYQERFFSNLCLVFTDYQVYYECQDHGGYQCESTNKTLVHRKWPMTLTGQNMFPVINSASYNAQFVVHPSQSVIKPAVLTALEDHIARYTCRDLTYDSDALNAVSAILREFELRGIQFLHGIPLGVHHDKSGPQKITYDNYRFSHGLCWTHGSDSHSHPPRRRRGFPSWSWAGWTRSVTWLPQALDKFHPSTAEVLEFAYKTSSGELSSISGLQRDAKLIDDGGKLLHVKAQALHLRFEWAQLSSDGSTGSKLPAPFLCSVEVSEPVPLHLTRHTTSRHDFKQRLSANTWTGLVLGHAEVSGTKYILVVGKVMLEDDFLERVGIIQVPDQWLQGQELHKAQFWLG